MENNTEKTIELLTSTIKELYAIELIFVDLKNNEVNINSKDTKFVIPYEDKREYLKSILNYIYNNQRYSDRVYYMITKEAEKTLRDNTQNIDRLLEYAIKIAIGN